MEASNEGLGDLLKAIRDAVSTTHHNDDDVALPLFNPDRNDCGSASWCDSIEVLAKDLKWSSIKTAAKAGKALKGSALTWFETWDPSEGRSWENFRRDIIDSYPEKRNLSEKLNKAVVYCSDSAVSYSEYAREKLRLLRNTKISFTDEQLIELICGGINEADIRMASLNSNITTTSSLISLLSTYSKTKKRPLESNDKNGGLGTSGIKRSKLTNDKCFTCKQSGHMSFQCSHNKETQSNQSPSIQFSKPTSQVPKPSKQKICTYCKRIGHYESVCYHKQRAEASASITLTPVEKIKSEGEHFLDKKN